MTRPTFTLEEMRTKRDEVTAAAEKGSVSITDAEGRHRFWLSIPDDELACDECGEGSPAWRRGIEASIRKVKYRQSVMPDLQAPAYRAALLDVLCHLEAMLERGTELSATAVADGGER